MRPVFPALRLNHGCKHLWKLYREGENFRDLSSEITGKMGDAAEQDVCGFGGIVVKGELSKHVWSVWTDVVVFMDNRR